MAHTQHDSATQRLLKKFKTELAPHEQMGQNLARAEHYDDSLLVDVLENEQLSLRARALLAWVLTRQDGFVISHSLLKAIGDDRIGVYAALRELEDKGFAKHTQPNRWAFSAVPDADSRDAGAAQTQQK